jgi:hypothetical protein
MTVLKARGNEMHFKVCCGLRRSQESDVAPVPITRSQRLVTAQRHLSLRSQYLSRLFPIPALGIPAAFVLSFRVPY